MQVKDAVALIAGERHIALHAQRHLAPQDVKRDQHLLDQRLRGLPAEGDHLDRQGEGAEMGDLLGGVGDHDHLVRGGRDDLFAQMRPAAPLDEVQVGVEFIGPVDGQVKPARLFQRDDGDPFGARQRRRAVRGRDAGDLQPLLPHPLAQTAHHPGRGRAGPKPHPHPPFDEIDRAPGGREFRRLDRGQVGGHGSLHCGSGHVIRKIWGGREGDFGPAPRNRTVLP